MSDTQVITQLKFKISSLESQLADRQKVLEEYQTIQSEADAKIKAINKMHADKVKNLLNSIQILKKEKASVEGLSKQHKRSKLIEQLNKEIGDQDLAIQVLRKWVYEKQGKDKGREICDQIIINALNKGPERIRPLSRQQLRIEIDRLKSININLQSKLKNGTNTRGNKKLENDQQLSQISSVSQKSFINQNDQILKKLRQLQYENQNMKLQVNAKLKIIQKLKTDIKETDKIRTQLQIYKNQIEVANKKVQTYERLIKQSKQNTNAKIIQLYERQIKVQELEMVSKQNRDKLKQAQQTHNILLEEIRLEKEQLQAEIESIKGQNEQILMQNLTQKRRLEQLKKIIKDMDDLHGKQKQDMKTKMTAFQQQIKNIINQNEKLKKANLELNNAIFTQRAQWVDQKFKLDQQLDQMRNNKANIQIINKYLDDIAVLKKQNQELKQLIEGGTGTGTGTGSGNDKVLLARIAAYEQKIKFLQDKLPQNELYTKYNQMLKKYEDLLQQFEAYKLKYGPIHKQGHRKQLIQLTQKQKSQYQVMSSGISRLGLQDVSSDILDNFDSSLQYEFVINEKGQRVKMPKLTEIDRELLKLMTSDLWDFVTDDRMEKNIQKAAEFASQIDDQQQRPPVDFKVMRKLKNISNPRGKKMFMYEQQMDKLNQMSDAVSITSALDKQLNKFDSDVNIQIKRLPRGATTKPLNTYKVQDMSMSVDGLSQLSSAKLGQSNLGKKKKKVEEKGSRIDFNKLRESQKSSDFDKSSIGSALLDSDVSSGGIRDSKLAMMNSDVDIDFKKKK